MLPPNGNLSSISLEYIEGLHEDFLRDPATVSPEWQRYFAESGELNGATRVLRPSFLPRSLLHRTSIDAIEGTTVDGRIGVAKLQERVDQLIRAYRVRGHMIAKLDPLGT